MAGGKAQDAASLDQYLRRAKIGKPIKSERFSRHLESQFGARVRRIIELIDDRAQGRTQQRFWAIKNEDLDLSLALTSQFMSDFYRAYWPWFASVSRGFRSGRLLDIGCDNGVLTCCYAQYFPEMEITGIDTCPEAVRCGTELAQRLQLSNVSFRVGSAAAIGEIFPAGTFALIAATMIYHNVQEIPVMPSGWSLKELALPDHAAWSGFLKAARAVTAEGGRFLSIERLTSAAAILWWSRTLADAGFFIDWPACDALSYATFGETHRRPAFACGTAAPVRPEADDALAFWAQPELVDIATKSLEGDAAEAFFNSFASTQLIWGIEGKLHEHNLIDRLEVFDAGAVILAYTNSSTGNKRLVIGPRHRKAECIEQCRGVWRSRPYNELREYNSIAEREARGT
jgi:SAM-dependent methyltransferase